MDRDLESTATLIRRIQEGDLEERERLVSRCLSPLKSWAHGRLPAHARGLADTDDLVQVTLMRAVNNLDRFEPQREGAFLAYVRTILVNAVRNELRRAGRKPPPDPLEVEPRAFEPSVVDRLVSEETLASYESALEQLPLGQRQAVILRVEFGMSFPEIAVELDESSADSVRMKVSRGLAKIARTME
ncbi:MAG: sigma-70 family RNA polymerase sigma factor [Acidobacteriota bacterium]